MKFLGWLFNVPVRHYHDARRYEKGGMGQRIFVLIFFTALLAGSLFLEYYAANLTFGDEQQMVGIILLIVALILILSLMEYSFVLSYFGFTTAARGTLGKLLEKGNKKSDSVPYVQTPNATEERRVPKGLDIFLGIYFLLLGIAALGVGAYILIGKM